MAGSGAGQRHFFFNYSRFPRHFRENFRRFHGVGGIGDPLKRKEYLTPEEVETVYSLKATTLANKRMRGIGPSYSKDGEKVLYAQSSIRLYLEKRTIRTAN